MKVPKSITDIPGPNQRLKSNIAVATIASCLSMSTAYAGTDRLDSANPGNVPVQNAALNNGKLLGETAFIFDGTNPTTTTNELHSISLLGDTNGNRLFLFGRSTSDIKNVSGIFELPGTNQLVIGSDSGTDFLSPGDQESSVHFPTVPNATAVSTQGGNVYMVAGGDLHRFDANNISSGITVLTTSGGISSCTQAMALAPLGSQKLVFIENGTLKSVSNGSSIVVNLLQSQTFSAPCDLFAYNNRVFFDAFESDNTQQIFVSDGTTNGTKRLKSFDSAASGGSFFPHFANFKDKFLLSVKTENTLLYDLWISDGTDLGTTKLQVVGGTEEANGRNKIRPDLGFLYNDNLFFPVNDQLWRTDGTTDGTVIVNDAAGNPINIGDGSFASFDNYLMFVGAGKLYRMESPTAIPEIVSDTGGKGDITSISGALENQLLVSTAANLYVMDKEPVVSIDSIPPFTEQTGDNTLRATIRLSSAVSYDVSGAVKTEDTGSALPGADYNQLLGANQSFTILAGAQEAEVQIGILINDGVEPDETFDLVVSDLKRARFSDRSATSIRSTATIISSDVAPPPVTAGNIQIQSSVTRFAEDSGRITISVITGGVSDEDINLTYTIGAGSTGSAAGNNDFSDSGTGSAVIPAGSTSARINIDILEDEADEPVESFTLSVTPTSGVAADVLNIPVSAEFFINDNDATVVEPPATSSDSGGGATGPMLPLLGAFAGLLIAIRRKYQQN